MSKPIITYMRKKNQLGDPQAKSVSRVHKRSSALCTTSALSTKKLRISEDVQSELQFQTPYPTAFCESQIFKLPSSKASPLSPDHQFSPLPLAPKNASSSNTRSRGPAYTRSSNPFLKENVIGKCSALFVSNPSSRPFRSNTQDGVSSTISAINLTGAYNDGISSELASPFSSRPSSPKTSPEKAGALTTSEFTSCHLVRTQAQSTTASPVQPSGLSMLDGEPLSSTSLRRPSAPTASRPRVDSWTRLLPRASYPESHKDERDALESFPRYPDTQKIVSEDSQPGHLEPPPWSATFQEREKWIWTDAAVDFNRPPSQLSFNLDFFNDVQGASTPLRDIRHSRETHLVAQDSSESREISYRSPLSSFDGLPDESSTFAGGLNSWITDSLISPPSVYRRRRGGPSTDKLRDLDDTDSGDDDSDSDDFSGCLREPQTGDMEYTTNSTSRAVEAQSGEDISLAIYAGNLSVKDTGVMPEALSINGAETIKKIITAKAASDLMCTKSQQTGRMRRGTIRASDHALQPPKGGQGRRNRSGTIIGPSTARRTRSGTIIGPVPHTKAAPGVAKNRQSSIIPGGEKMDPSYATSSTSDTIVAEDHDDDPINAFKEEEWVDEPWVVADPPSPLVVRARRNTRALRQTKCLSSNKKIILERTMQTGIEENTTGSCVDSSDDELLLK